MPKFGGHETRRLPRLLPTHRAVESRLPRVIQPSHGENRDETRGWGPPYRSTFAEEPGKKSQRGQLDGPDLLGGEACDYSLTRFLGGPLEVQREEPLKDLLVAQWPLPAVGGGHGLVKALMGD